MPLNLSTSAIGDFVPYLKYNAKSGRLSVRGDDGEPCEIAMPLKMIFDFAAIGTGWLQYLPGTAPDFVFDQGGITAPQPAGQYKRGFAVDVYGGSLGVREFSSTAAVCIAAVKAIYDEWETSPEATQGLLPVVEWQRVEPVKTKHGVSYAPVLHIVEWRRRPDCLWLRPRDGSADPQMAPAPAPAPQRAPTAPAATMPPADPRDAKERAAHLRERLALSRPGFTPAPAAATTVAEWPDDDTAPF